MKRNHIIESDILRRIIKSILLLIIILFVVTGNPRNIDSSKKIKADVLSFHLLNTEIEFHDYETKEMLYISKGGYIKIVTDPLTLYDVDKSNTLGYASDELHIVKQDSHVIYTYKGNKAIEMVGKIQFPGDAYDIYVEGQLVAKASFYPFNIYGSIKDISGEIIADYTSKLFFNDFIIQIKSNDVFCEEEIALIFASYYSDQKFDNMVRSYNMNNTTN